MLSRSDRHWQILICEYKDCKQKLKSKKEAQKIMQKMLTSSEMDVDKLKKQINSLEVAAEELVSKARNVPNLEKFNVPREGLDEKRSVIQGLILFVSKLQREVDTKEKLLSSYKTENSDLIKDLKALRSDMTGRNRVVSPSTESQPEENPNREDFLLTIQSLKQEVDLCKDKIKTLNDEATDFRIEREFYKQKVHSLTDQLVEKSSCQPIADIEKLLDENRLLKDKIDKLQHINAALVAHSTSSNLQSYSSRRTGVRNHVTFEDEQSLGFMRSVKEKVKVETELQQLQVLIEDMQKVSNGLAETVLDKTTALKHQRASNRLLGDRVTELEAKLRALEMSGFWNVPEGFADKEEDKRQVLQRLTLGSSEDRAGLLTQESNRDELLVDPSNCSEIDYHVTSPDAMTRDNVDCHGGSRYHANDSNSQYVDELTSLLSEEREFDAMNPNNLSAPDDMESMVDLLPVKEIQDI